MSIRLICLDLDGTTLRRDGTVSPRTAAALRRAMAADVQVAIATGRFHGSGAQYARRLGLNAPVISSNGGLIRTLSGQTLLHRPLPQSVVDVAPDVARATGAQVGLFTHHTLFQSDPERRRQGLWARFAKHPTLRGALELMQTLRTYRIRGIEEWRPADGLPEKVFITGEKVTEACDMLVRLVPERLTVTSSDPDNLEVTAEGVTKGAAVAWLAGHLNVALEQVMVAGDGLNDLSMFDLDCLRVAMGNAAPAILERATYVSAHHMEDGVAQAIERLVLKEDVA